MANLDTSNEVIVETTQDFPSHFMVRIETFSLFSANTTKEYKSTEFKAGGHNWRLVIYPNGKECGTDGDNVSVYLSVSNPGSLPLNWEVNAMFSIFLHNQISDNFLCMREKTRRRFHALAPSRGFPKFVSKKVLNDTTNGYLVDDVCVFGAEVFVFEKPNKIERLSFTKDAEPYVQTWTIPKFSKIKTEFWSTGNFTLGNQSWCVRLYPQGLDNGKGRSISLFLHLVGGNKQKVRAKCTLRIKDQTGDKHRMRSFTHWLEHNGYGWPEFMSIADLKDPKKGFLVKDRCILEAEITVLAVARFSP